jgi:hypothetical protein
LWFGARCTFTRSSRPATLSNSISLDTAATLLPAVLPQRAFLVPLWTG